VVVVVVLVHVVGFAPGPGNDGSDGGLELQWNYGLEPKRKRLKEQDFLENNSQISSVDFLQARSVSTGLGLSLDNTRVSSSGDSALLSLIGDDIDSELQRQDVEVDKFLKIQVGICLKITALFQCKMTLPVAIF
jgi:E3 ubiquitin-protein ligase BOI-like protein